MSIRKVLGDGTMYIAPFCFPGHPSPHDSCTYIVYLTSGVMLRRCRVFALSYGLGS